MSVAMGITRLIASFSPVPATSSMGLRSAMPVRVATTGRPSLIRTATARGSSTSIRATTKRTATAAHAAGCLFVLSKSSPNSERSECV